VNAWFHDIPREFFWLFGSLVLLLGIASGVGTWLRTRPADAKRAASRANLVERINAWWVMVGILAVAFLGGSTPTLILFALASFFALREFVTLTPSSPGDRLPLSLSFFVVLPLQFVLIGLHRYGLFAIFIPVWAFLLLPSIAAMRSDVDDFLSRSAKQQWGLMVTVYSLSHAPALLMLDLPGGAGRSELLLFYLLLVVQMSDVMQYVFGKLFGRTKIAPLVSPSKTVEGFIGGRAGGYFQFPETREFRAAADHQSDLFLLRGSVENLHEGLVAGRVLRERTCFESGDGNIVRGLEQRVDNRVFREIVQRNAIGKQMNFGGAAVRIRRR